MSSTIIVLSRLSPRETTSSGRLSHVSKIADDPDVTVAAVKDVNIPTA